MRQMYKVALLALAMTATAGAVDPGLLRFADPEINFLMGVRVRELASSPLMLKVLDESKKGGAGWSGLFDEMGPNPFASIEEVLIMGRIDAGEAPDAAEDGVIVARGDFSGSAFRDALCAKSCTDAVHSGVAMHLIERDGKRGAFAALGNNYAALGSEDKVRALIERNAAGGNPQFATRAQEWAKGLAGHQVWIAAQGPFEAPQGGDAPPFAQDMLNGLEGVGMGLTIGEELQISMDLRSKTEADSQRLYTTLQGLMAMASMSQPGQEGAASGPADLLRQVKMTQAAKRVTATLRAPADTLQKTFAAKMSEAPAAFRSEPAYQADAPRERSGKIRIYGLESEPVEVEAGRR